MTTVTLRRTRIEVGRPQRGRPAYVWTTGYYVVGPDNVKLYPPCRRAEAYETARRLWPGCRVEIKEES